MRLLIKCLILTNKTMTVQELIERLEEMDPEATVLLDIGDVNLIEAGSVKELIAMEAVVIE